MHRKVGTMFIPFFICGKQVHQLLPWLTQTLQTIKQEEQNAGSPEPYWSIGTDYEGLYVLRQRYTEHHDDKISSVQEIIDDINRE